MIERLGVDLSGVVFDRNVNNNMYPLIQNAFETLNELREKRFINNVFVVSRATSDEQAAVFDRLLREDFYRKTGIPFNQIYFCKKRKHKARICSSLGITHFIDDRTEVLTHLLRAGVKELYLFQGRSKEIEPNRCILPFVTQVSSWQEVGLKLLGEVKN